MRVVYSGPHPAVVVDELDSDLEIVRGEPVSVPDELGVRLVEQSTWDDVTPRDLEPASQEKAREEKAAAKAAENTTKADS